MKTVAIIPARGGSKGLPKKNIRPFCGKPLIAWSIEQALQAKDIDSVWVTSDSDEILKASEAFGAKPILRPPEISGDTASSESAWLHAVEYVLAQEVKAETVLAIQCTSPIREASDFSKAIEDFQSSEFDSMLSVSELNTFFIWERDAGKETFHSANYDHRKRPRRQDLPERVLENGSFYLFKAQPFLKEKNRLFGRIGVHKMEFWKGFEIDTLEEFEFCEMVMKRNLLR